MDVVVSNRICRFANDTKFGNLVLADEDRQSLQEDLYKISTWSDRREMSFNVDTSQVLHIGTKNNKSD